MRRTFRLITGVLVIVLLAFFVSSLRAQKPDSGQVRKDIRDADFKTRRLAREQFYTMQASLFSALAHAQALEEITSEGTTEEVGGLDFSLSRNLIAIAGRSIQGTDSSSVALGQAIHSLEKTDAMKTMRDELNAATKAADEAHEAADGHGAIRPHAKNMVAHLLRAVTAMVEVANAAGIQPMAPPGFDAMKNAQQNR